MTTHVAADGTVRQDHYGAGRQPWDEILDEGWAPEFAAGNVLKYLRRDKEREHSLESARWYWERLHELARGDLLPLRARDGQPHAARERRISVGRANALIIKLTELLGPEHHAALREDDHDLG